LDTLTISYSATCARTAEGDDQLALCRVLSCSTEAEGRDRQAGPRRRPDGVDRRLGAVEVFRRLGLIEQEVEEALQVSFSRLRQLDGKAHRLSNLRLASSLDWGLANTVSTGTVTPVR